jgi:hypothetical protein
VSLSERLDAAKPNGNGLPCPSDTIFGSLNNENDKVSLQRQMTLPQGHPDRLSASAVEAILREEGYMITRTAVERHRRGDCRCAKGTQKKRINVDQ